MHAYTSPLCMYACMPANDTSSFQVRKYVALGATTSIRHTWALYVHCRCCQANWLVTLQTLFLRRRALARRFLRKMWASVLEWYTPSPLIRFLLSPSAMQAIISWSPTAANKSCQKRVHHLRNFRSRFWHVRGYKAGSGTRNQYRCTSQASHSVVLTHKVGCRFS